MSDLVEKEKEPIDENRWADAIVTFHLGSTKKDKEALFRHKSLLFPYFIKNTTAYAVKI